jgi:hypothetical protein
VFVHVSVNKLNEYIKFENKKNTNNSRKTRAKEMYGTTADNISHGHEKHLGANDGFIR